MQGFRPSLMAYNVTPLLYCHNTWVGTCHLDVLNITARPRTRRKTPSPIMINPALVGAVMRAMKANAALTPSAGMMAVALALRLCSQVALFGFSNLSDTSKGATCKHYFQCEATQAQYFFSSRDQHDWSGQWRLLTELAATGALSLLPESSQTAAFRWTAAYQ